MSFTTSLVPMFASISAPCSVRSAQFAANSFASASSLATPAADTSSSSSSARSASISSSVRHSTFGSLDPMPRGSKPTKSKRSARVSLASASDAAVERPATPGPPGLTTSAPIRSVRDFAGLRATPIRMVSPSGFA